MIGRSALRCFSTLQLRAFTKPNQQKTPSRFLKVTLAIMEFLTMANPLATGGFLKDIH